MTNSPIPSVVQHVYRLARSEGAGSPADHELLHGFCSGADPQAFTALVHRHGPLVLRVCRRVLGQHHDAEDAFQATFLILARRASSLRPGGSLAAWLHGVAYRVALQAKRNASRRQLHEARARAAEPSPPATEASWREVQAILHEEIERLPERLRAPFLLCCIEGLGQAEAGRQLGLKEGTVWSRLARARRQLRQRLTRRGIDLTAILAAAALAAEGARAALPGKLTATTAAAAARLAAGAAPETLSAGAATLLHQGLASMARAKLGAVVLWAAGLASLATAAVALQLMAGGQTQQAAGPAPAQPPGAVKPAAATDRDGDPLPAGAVARMGSTRLRHLGLADFVVLRDNRTVLTAGSDNVLRFWSLASGRQVRQVDLQGKPGQALKTLTEDGKTLTARVGADFLLWDTQTGKEIRRLPYPRQDVTYLVLSPDGKTLAVGTMGRGFTLLGGEDGKEWKVPLPATRIGMDSTFHGRFSADGKWFIAGGGWGEALCVYDRATRREAYRLDCNAASSVVSPDSKRLAVCSMKNERGQRECVLRLYELASGKEVKQIPLGFDESLYSLCFSPDGKRLAGGASDRACLVDCTTGRVLYPLSGRPWRVRFSPDGKALVANSYLHLRVWDAATGKERPHRPGEFSDPVALAVSPDGRLLAEASWLDQAVSLWDGASGRLVRRFPLGGDDKRYVRDLDFSADGKTLTAGLLKGLYQSWEVGSGREVRSRQLSAPGSPQKDFVYFFHLHAASDGKHASSLEQLVQGREMTRLGFWDTASGKLLHSHFLPPQSRACAWLDDGRTVAVSLPDGLKLLDVETGAARFHIPSVAQEAAVASPDERLLAARRKDGQAPCIGVWETATGKEVASLAAGPAYRFALAADGRSLVTSDERCLLLWDLATGKERGRWPFPLPSVGSEGSSAVIGLVLSPDGRRAFTALADGTALVWDLAPALARARPLTDKAGGREVIAWWEDLAAADAGRAHAAMWRLTETPGEAVPLLRRRLRAASPLDTEKVRLLVDLDSDTFATRERASHELEHLGSLAEPALRQALAKDPPLEVRRRLQAILARSSGLVRSPEALRRLRAIAVLERLGSAEARQVLTELAAGAPLAVETQAARAALQRMPRERQPQR